jgi:hypothetical protein
MREAERECYELNRRINAWTCLNEDRLKGSFSMPTTPSCQDAANNNYGNNNYVFLPSLFELFATDDMRFVVNSPFHI